MRNVAVVLGTLLAYGCATVRAPVSGLGEPLVALSDSMAEPQLELWLESGKEISPGELAQARDEARAALVGALAARDVAPGALGASDPLLVVRARAVARTPSRRSDQRAAIAGVVVGFVVVVVAVIVIYVLGKKTPKPEKPATAPAAASRPASSVRAPPRAVAIAPRPAPVPFPRPAPPPTVRPWRPAVPVPYRRHAGGADVFVGFEFFLVFPPPAPYAEQPPPPYAWAPAPHEPAPQPEAAPPAPALALSPMPDLPVEARGFFAGDETLLQLDLLDRQTGRLLWSRAVRDEVDPRDAGKIAALVDRALADQPWARRAAR